MSVLVCGGAGYIGSHCVKRLVELGEEVVVVDALYTGHRESVDDSAHFYEVDISNREEMDRIIKAHHVESCIHFSAYSLVGESMEKPLKYFKNNVCATGALLDVLNKNDVQHLVFSSTAAVYGSPDTKLIREDTRTNPQNPYGESKLTMEKMIAWNARATKMRYIALRYFNVAGASHDASIGEDHHPETHLLPIAIQRAMDGGKMFIYGDDYPTPDGTCVRDYIHIEDLVEAHILALRSLRDGKESTVYNLGYSHGFSVKEILSAVQRVVGKAMDIEIADRRPGDPAMLVADSSRIKEELGWKAEHDDLDFIIESAYRWHKGHPKGYDNA